MKKKKAKASGLEYSTPQQQLWKMLNDSQREEFREILRRLKKRDQESLCYGVIAFIKFGIRRPFESEFMQQIYNTMLMLLINKKTNRYGSEKIETDNN